jgi:maintenance of morphology protein 1
MNQLTSQRAEIDIDYLDTTSLSLSTSLLINFPRPRFAVLPVSLGVQLASIGGTVSCPLSLDTVANEQMSVQIHDAVEERQQLHVCLLPDFHLNLKTTTLLGSRAKLQGE